MGKHYDIDRIIEEVVSLPSLPGTVAQIMHLVDDPYSPLSLVAKAISWDPPLALKTLRLVNTAYYGLRQKVSTIEHSVVLLGTKVIKNLAFTAAVLDIMKDSVHSYFRHSVACAVAIRSIALTSGKLPVDSPEEAFVYGLLHDIGKVLFDRFMPEEAEKVRQLVASERISTYAAERRIIGVDHAELGAVLAQRWKLPEPLVNAIKGHHEVGRCRNENDALLASVIGVADLMCTRCGIASDEGPVTVSENAWAKSSLTTPDIMRIMAGFFNELPAIDELIAATQ